MAIKRTKQIPVYVPEVLTHDEWLKKANEEAVQSFKYTKEQGLKEMASIQAAFAKEDARLSSVIAWKAEDLLKAEIKLDFVQYFENLTSADRPEDDWYTPWQATKCIYLKVQEVLLEQSSFAGQDLLSCSTSPAHNAMSTLRMKALGSCFRWDLKFVNYYAKKLNDNFLSTGSAREGR